MTPNQEQTGSVPKFWTPFLHCGRTFGPWCRFLNRHLFHINWRCWPALVVVTLIGLLRSLFALITRVRYGGAVARTEVRAAPIFVLGHWRTGTTLLHELLALDGRFASPTLYQCFFPAHFLLTERLVMRLLARRPPFRRAQDNMLVTAASPGEDEIALAQLGAGSPYAALALPNVPRLRDEYLDLLALPPPARERWKRMFLGFLRALTFRHGRRLVLKSPTHTARVKTLLEIFPDARFVNIVRDPRVVYSSTLHMWRSLTPKFSLQRVRYTGAGDHILRNYRMMHQRLAEARPLVPAGHFCEARYEELVRNPIAVMERVYAELGLGGFDTVRPQIEAYFAARKDYQTNRHTLPPEEHAKVERELARVIAETGYQ
jgi:hypothetical protein